MRIGFLNKNCLHPPPPPPGFVNTNFFFNVGNSIKREENIKYWKQNS